MAGPEDFPAAAAGGIALIGRGTLNFSDKVRNAMNAGAVAAVIYDNTTSMTSGSTWTLGAGGDWISAVGITRTSGQSLMASGLPSQGTVINSLNPDTAFQYQDGTSMAAPHVSGALGFAAWNFPGESMAGRVHRILGTVTKLPALAGRVATGGNLDLLKIVDSDADTLPDWWETDFFGGLTQPASADPDRDGLTNAQEFAGRTQPAFADGAAAVLVARIAGDDRRDLVLSFNSVAGRSYQLEASASLEPATWQALGGLVTGTGASVEVSDPGALAAHARRFYRLRME